MRYSNPYKFPVARRRKGNLYKSKQSSTASWTDLIKFDVQELIPEQPKAQPLCSDGDVAELFLAETKSVMPGESCSNLQVKDMDSSSEFTLEDETTQE